METTASNFVVHEVDVTRDYGREVASSYQFYTQHLPSMFIIDPITHHCETEVPLKATQRHEYDGCAVVNHLLEFVMSFSSPREYAKKQDDAFLQGSEPVAEVVDCDEAPPVAAPVPSVEPAVAAPPTPLPQPVSLAEWEVPASADGAFRLRCRLPRRSAPLELVLRSETPVAVLVDYLSWKVHDEDSLTYTAPPAIVLRGGFPPKELDTPDGATLASWAGVRSGEMLTVQIKN
ncbi:hypothetical protein STCU_00675 [Strigomonas culicis]|nr:hypothetical protein STCU_00675 [Strigomonas culicis]|eukprot:EPY36259.1 hypothetical protein STCU_00675 [Strigomonas culicis]